MAMTEFTHFDSDGNAHMVDVGSKADTKRIAIVKGHIRMQPETLAMITDGTAKKGDVLGVARLAGIMGAKQTSNLIPLCHPLGLDHVHLDLVPTRPCPAYKSPQPAPFLGQPVLKWRRWPPFRRPR